MWFAWKIVLLQYHKQPLAASSPSMPCCDLLEKSYFCSITNSIQYHFYRYAIVVICLKNRTFAVSQTAYLNGMTRAERLWFAWKIVLLQYHKQLTTEKPITKLGCDLLEKSYFCSITNSSAIKLLKVWRVVICLKNRTFAVSQTASIAQF